MSAPVGWLLVLGGCALGPAMTTDVGRRECDAYTSENVSVLWMVPRDDNDRRQLDSWCRAVGPIVFVPNASIEVADAGPADPVVLAVDLQADH